MRLYKAAIKEFESIITFYDDVTDMARQLVGHKG